MKHIYSRLYKFQNRNKHLMQSLLRACVINRSIECSLMQAKVLRYQIEPLITVAKKVNNCSTVSHRRILLSKINHSQDVLNNLLKIASDHSDRCGGYCSIQKIRIRSDSTTIVRISV